MGFHALPATSVIWATYRGGSARERGTAKTDQPDRAPRARTAGVLSPSSMEDRNFEVSIDRPWRAPPASGNQRITPPPSRSAERSHGHANGGQSLPSKSYHASANTLQVDGLAIAPSVAHLCDTPRPNPFSSAHGCSHHYCLGDRVCSPHSLSGERATFGCRSLPGAPTPPIPR